MLSSRLIDVSVTFRAKILPTSFRHEKMFGTDALEVKGCLEMDFFVVKSQRPMFHGRRITRGAMWETH